MRFLSSLLLGVSAVSAAVTARHSAPATVPTVTVKNGSYYGLSLPHYSQELFLGVPFAQPPVGDLRFRVPQPLNSTWTGTRNATAYGPSCIGYGSDDWVLGNVLSEDCLTLNVVRPRATTATRAEELLPVALWIYGGAFAEGGSRDPRYNLTFIVQQSVELGAPMLAVSINYRVAQWGFMYGRELAAEGSNNMGLRDQRQALRWVQENIAAFGGDPARVTIWGESAGADSVGIQLIAYGGRDDGLFRGAIGESGLPVGWSPRPTTSDWQSAYDAYINATGCSAAVDSLACLRAVPAATLSAVFNSTISRPAFEPVTDGDFLTQSGTTALRRGDFVKVPYLVGANFDEGGSLATRGINSTNDFLALVRTKGPDNATALTIAALYPDIPAIGIPATLHGRPPASDLATYGYQWKRSAAYAGDLLLHASRRLTSQSWAQNNASLWSYHFNVLVNGVSPLQGSVHFQEVVFVFANTQGLGYENVNSVNPFAGKPQSYFDLARTMSRMWVSFVTHQDPNALKVESTTSSPLFAYKIPDVAPETPLTTGSSTSVSASPATSPTPFSKPPVADSAVPTTEPTTPVRPPSNGERTSPPEVAAAVVVAGAAVVASARFSIG
ncbi:carboxylesterase family protein [Grosmannia clavigera kw1407]|uniref:Carboxylic ester hydrolase n=1 Tax=Grosmannia clavigera (strain kw1407 / UAMH 11150) TaxID=655863 RepID=F0XIP5_GROCL|nr:carboxylesterase family protein [Grosmannia clavigera kw1407]EFX02028.1 carboxylesterase family protein [Grosmannia clavigera kw1407]